MIDFTNNLSIYYYLLSLLAMMTVCTEEDGNMDILIYNLAMQCTSIWYKFRICASRYEKAHMYTLSSKILFVFRKDIPAIQKYHYLLYPKGQQQSVVFGKLIAHFGRNLQHR